MDIPAGRSALMLHLAQGNYKGIPLRIDESKSRSAAQFAPVDVRSQRSFEGRCRQAVLKIFAVTVMDTMFVAVAAARDNRIVPR
jgi:hypothetical protein